MHPSRKSKAGLKRVLVLNADSFVGAHVCRCFFDKEEYLVDGTLYYSPELRSKATGCNKGEPEVPEEMRTFLYSVMPRHGTISDEQFRARVLKYDIIIAILEEDAFEADCTIKVLRGTHYEVEKTFVLVSNVMTWAQTDMYELEQRRAARRAAREAELEARRIEREENGEDEEDPEEEEEEEEEDEELKLTDWTEDEYRRRQPDIRYNAWRELEHTVKHANSETLHTYVLWSGLPYGGGEHLLAPYFNSAWKQGTIQQYGDGSNYVPTIHVHDLSRIIYLVGSSYDTLDERYMFAVDQGNNTQAEILQGICDYIGGTVEVLPLSIDRDSQAVEILHRKEGREKEMATKFGLRLDESHVELAVNLPHGLANWFSAVNLRCEPGAVLALLEENEWVGLGGFFASASRAMREFKEKSMRQPLRIVVSGPPFSQHDVVSARLGEIFGIPRLTLDSVIESYQAYVVSLREEISEIILRRRARQRAIREERLRRAKELEEKRLAAAAAEEDEEEDEEGGDKDEEGGDGDAEEEEEEEGEEEEEEGGESAEPPGPDTVSEAQILRGLEDEEDEEEAEEPDDDEPISRAAARAAERAAEAAALVNETERRRLAELRAAYGFAMDLLRLRLENGKFPSRPTDEEDEEDEEGMYDDEDAVRLRRRREEARRKKAAALAAAPPPVIRYLDEALAVMLRWRLRCEDCRSQGYILDGFPKTVRQARLVFLADTEEQKEKLIPRLQRELEEAAEPPQPPDATFPLPNLNEMEETQQQEMLSAMDGKTFVAAEEALVPAHAGFFPDCFLALTCSRGALQAEVAAARKDTASAQEFYEQLTEYERHTRESGPPTESLITWFQTVTTEREVEEEENEKHAAAEGMEDGPQGEKPPRMAAVLLLPSPISLNINALSAKSLDETAINNFCELIHWRVKSCIGENFCGPVVVTQRDEEELEALRLAELELEAAKLESLDRINEVLATAARDELEQSIEEERRVLRYYQAKEEREGVVNIESMHSSEYLMTYVLPSLTPLMAEIVRQRPDDPVAALADRLFHHKRKTEIGE